MGRYVLGRILLIFPTILIASIMVAGMLRLVPGDAIDVVTRGQLRTEESRQLARARLGLDKPFYEQYLRWMFAWPVREASILRTGDGGSTWTELRGPSIKPFSSVAFPTATEGWAIWGGTILRTTDGGRVWSVDHTASERQLNALAFVDKRYGWAVGDDGLILHLQATERGRNGSPAGWQSQDAQTSENFIDVFFIDEQTGWAVAEQGTVISTGDGGASWSLQAAGVGAGILAAAFADDNKGWMVGREGLVLHSTDGGRTWSEQDSGTSDSLRDVTFLDEQRGWAVGDRGTILHTSDGGRTWSVRRSGTEQRLTGVQFGDDLHGLIVGEGGTVLRTMDGGLTWSRAQIQTAKALKDITLAESRGGSVIAWAPGEVRRWRWGLVTGNMGESFGGEASVADLLARRIPISLQLALMSLAIALVFAIPIGVYSAIRQDTLGDYASRAIAISGLAVPSFWVATLMLVFGSIWFQWAPPVQYTPLFKNPVESLRFLALPALVAAFPAAAIFMRMTRATMLEVYHQDYVRTARAKGLRERLVLSRHALKNALIPVVTLIGMEVPFLLGELVLIERIFNVPGLGRLIFESFSKRDFPVVQAASLVIAVSVVFMNLVVDLAYARLDPRIRYG